MKNFIQWITFNIGIGLIPVLFKGILYYCLPDNNKINVLEASDLILLTLIVCLSILNEDKDNYFLKEHIFIINFLNTSGAILSTFFLTLNIILETFNILINEKKFYYLTFFFAIVFVLFNSAIIYRKEFKCGKVSN